MYFLDTNTCIYFLKGTYSSILEKIETTDPSDIKIPSLVKAELLLGAEKSARKEETERSLRAFLDMFEVIGFGDDATLHYARIRAFLEKSGMIIVPNDLIIAATVRAKKGILVTNNVREFAKVPDLLIEDWTISNTAG